MLADPLLELKTMAEVLRKAIEPGLMQPSNGRASSEGACLHASVLLCFSLSKFFEANVEIRGGSGDLGFGALGDDGLPTVQVVEKDGVTFTDRAPSLPTVQVVEKFCHRLGC